MEISAELQNKKEQLKLVPNLKIKKKKKKSEHSNFSTKTTMYRSQLKVSHSANQNKTYLCCLSQNSIGDTC